MNRAKYCCCGYCGVPDELTERRRTTATVHGLHGTPEYKAWVNLIDRCFNDKHPYYKDYGGRGITVWEDWRSGPEAFVKYVGPRPSPEHSIDRKDNDRGYEPGNVRWATAKEQARNRRKRAVKR